MTISPNRPGGLFILDPEFMPLIYGRANRRELERLANFFAPPQTRESIAENRGLLADAEVIFTGWGAPVLDEEFLKAAPKLSAVFYGAGSIHHIVTDEFWARDISIASASVANARPVAEYTLGAILLSLKSFWDFKAQAKRGTGWGSPGRHVAGAFRSTVALIGCGKVARRVIELLEPFDIHCIVYDPFLREAEADELGVELCSLTDAFARGDVVSLHAPDKAQTRGLITGEHFLGMKPNATFINTARGFTVCEEEMIAALNCRRDVMAILDVFQEEPPASGSPLFEMPNVIMTPHIAGSLGPECERLGRYMVEEFQRYLKGTPLQWQVTRELAVELA